MQLAGPELWLGNGSGAALRAFIGEALAACRATDPDLGATLANVVEIWVTNSAPSEASKDQTSSLLAVRQMLIYAQAEAESEAGQRHLARKLELCISCLADRIERATSGSARLRLHS